MHPPPPLRHPLPPTGLGLAPAVEDTLRPLRRYVAVSAISAAFPGHPAAAIDEALAESALAGRIVRDADGRVRLNPIFRSHTRTPPDAIARARVVLHEACRQAPADLSLRVARFAIADWDDPAAVDDARAFFERIRFGMRARELVDKLDAADLLSTLMDLCPRAVLALLLDAGRLDQARPLIGGHDPYLQALLALHEGRHDDAQMWLAGVAGLAARFLRIEVYRATFDYDHIEAELTDVPSRGLPPLATLQRAFYAHRVACFRSRWNALDPIVEQMWAAATELDDGSLQCRVLDARLSVTIRWGDVPASVRLLSQLERLVGAGWSPGLQARLALYQGFVADLAGDHLRLRTAVRRPFSVPADDLLRQLQLAALMVLEGDAPAALETAAVRASPGLHAQFLTTVGRFDQALPLVEAAPPGYAEPDHIILRGPIEARLGRGKVYAAWPDITPYQHCKLAWSNALTLLAEGRLDDAHRWACEGLDTARQRSLWDLGASLLLTRADIHVRQGHPDEARADLARFDELGRHDHDYRVNLATVARACLDDTPPDASFIARLVQQHDRVSLAVLAVRWSVGAAAESLLTDLPEALTDQLESAFLAPCPRSVLIVRNDARQVVLPDGTSLDLRRSGAPRRVLLALARHHRVHSGLPLNADVLIEQGWPGERIHWDSARTRLYTVIRRLRARGLDQVETVDGGYRLSPALEVVVHDPAPSS